MLSYRFSWLLCKCQPEQQLHTTKMIRRANVKAHLGTAPCMALLITIFSKTQKYAKGYIKEASECSKLGNLLETNSECLSETNTRT